MRILEMDTKLQGDYLIVYVMLVSEDGYCSVPLPGNEETNYKPGVNWKCVGMRASIVTVQTF